MHTLGKVKHFAAAERQQTRRLILCVRSEGVIFMFSLANVLSLKNDLFGPTELVKDKFKLAKPINASILTPSNRLNLKKLLLLIVFIKNGSTQLVLIQFLLIDS